jgi:hypothetical protein
VLDGYLVYNFILYYYTQRDGKHQISAEFNRVLLNTKVKAVRSVEMAGTSTVTEHPTTFESSECLLVLHNLSYLYVFHSFLLRSFYLSFIYKPCLLTSPLFLSPYPAMLFVITLYVNIFRNVPLQGYQLKIST